MFKSNHLFGAMLLSAVVLSSCDKENNDFQNNSNKEESENPIKPSYATNFKFLTINGESTYGDPATISFVTHDNEITEDKYYETNSALIGGNVTSVKLIGDTLYAVHTQMDNRYYTDCAVELLDPSTLQSLKKIPFGYSELGFELSSCAIESIGGGDFLLAGTLFYSAGGDGDNIAVASLNEEKFVKSSFRADFPIRIAHKIGDKILLAGNRNNGRNSKIAILDKNNISESGLTILKDEVNIFDGNSHSVIDKNNKMWLLTHNVQSAKLYCIDVENSRIEHEIQLPYVITSLTSAGLTINSAKDKLYIRAVRAFYTVDVDSPSEPEDVVFEYFTPVVSGGMNVVELKMTEDDKLVFLNQKLENGAKSVVLEFDPITWEQTNEYEVGISASQIYVPKR